MSATAVHAGQAAPSPYSPNSSYLDQNAEAYYNNATASGSGSLSARQERKQQAYSPQAQQQYSQSQDDYSRYAPPTSIPYHLRDQAAPVDQYDGAPNVPTRTSSQQQGSPHTPPAPSTAPLEQRVAASRQARQYTPEEGRERSRDDTATAAASAARSRRRGPASPDGPQRATSTRERNHHANGPSQTRSEAAIHSNPLVRENSEVINRVVVSDPRVDADRMQERVAESQPAPINDPESAVHRQETAPGPARRQDYSKSSSKRRDVQFGDYVLGQTLGEGEFGKVKLGWKKDGSTQVAIKLIRKDTVQNHPGRLPKIHREIAILRDLAHPNIVRLHEMVETERNIGIILEYASGGELFDYILNHRYLKDPAARRLFAQLVSGVGYLHKKGIVHRDLKLENLLLDQNRNIIITDFGFANTFNPSDSLSDEIEYNLANKDFVRKFKLDRLDAKGMRRGDLMQTSCGSPCYAAPELVVSDSLYTGKKVDVWSCGVILYAMLAGYLPFDDDPANPEGDNINLLYKYITTTPLTFPEYVSPHARDLLRRILVPDPRKRADLFEVARHSWLSEYHHVVSHVTSSTTNIADISNSTTTGGEFVSASPSIMTDPTEVEPLPEPAIMNRSASVREPTKPISQPTPPTTLARTPEGVNETDQVSHGSQRERGTRHTLQAEYVAPNSHTTRGQPLVSAPATTGYAATTQPEEKMIAANQPASLSQKQLPQLPQEGPSSQSQDYNRAITAQQKMPPPTRPARDVPRSVSDSTGAFATQQPNQYTTRPSTQGSITSSGHTRSDLRLPSRGSYGQPVAPTVATTNAQGRVTQPAKTAREYNISGPMTPQHKQQASMGQSMAQQMPPSSYQQSQKSAHHRRSSTLSGLGEKLFGRSGSIRKKEDDRPKNGRKYPPTSMKPYQTDGEAQSRMSTDSKRSFSFGLGKKRSTDLESQHEKSGGRRFSLLPQSWSLKSMSGSNKDDAPEAHMPQMTEYSQESRPTTGQHYGDQSDGSYDAPRPTKVNNFSRPPQAQYRQRPPTTQGSYDAYGGTGVYAPSSQNPSQHSRGASQPITQFQPQYPEGFADPGRPSMQQGRQGRGVLTKQNRKFTDTYDDHHTGSTGAVKKVQDFFRRRGRARADSGYQ